MNKFLILLTAAVFTLCATSCDKLSKAADSLAKTASETTGGENFSTSEGLNAVIKSLEKNNGDKFHITRIQMSEDDEFSGKTTGWSLNLVDENSQVYTQYFHTDGNVGDLKTRINSRITPETWDSPHLTPSEINVDAIIKALDEIKSMTPDGYTFKSIARLNIEPEEINVSTRITKNGEETVTNAGKTQEVYYEGSYSINPKTWKVTDNN